jgi:hypothetical protein
MVTLKDLTEEVVSASGGAVPLEEKILESLREKGFSRSSVTDTALELGGLNRGTVAEYLRGQCLKAFVEHSFDVDIAAEHIALSADPEVVERVRKRLREYLENIAEVVDPGKPWEASREALRVKTKNLPQRYHPHLEQVAESFRSGNWKLEP